MKGEEPRPTPTPEEISRPIPVVSAVVDLMADLHRVMDPLPGVWSVRSIGGGGQLGCSQDDAAADPLLVYGGRAPICFPPLLWAFEPVEGHQGFFAIRNKNNNKRLHGREPGSNELHWADDAVAADDIHVHWALVKVSNDVYAIHCRSHGGFLDGRTSGVKEPMISFKPPMADTSLHWEIKSPIKPDTVYSLQSRSSGRFLDGKKPRVRDPGLNPSNPHGNPCLNWVLRPVNGGGFTLENISSRGYLDGHRSDLLIAYHQDYNAAGQLQWDFIPMEKGQYYAIKCRCGTGYLDGRRGEHNPLATQRDPVGDDVLHWALEQM
ncbi:hypothetical protein Pelo_8819 [Pelomyxa schiedti]|nr:hypothetical protein Pelo_8819 [Pelomyxa schiedti]